MKTIIVATDFSKAASNAADYAMHLAMAVNADLHLLHIFQLPIVYNEAALVINPDDLCISAEEKLGTLKNELDERARGKFRISVEVSMGAFFLELEKTCDRIHPYLVVMGSQGTTAGERFLLGSHTVYVVRHLKWPVITVPKNATFSAVKRIGLACDLEQVVDTIPADEIKTLVNDWGAELHILNTGKESVYNPDLVFESGLLQKLLFSLKPNFHFIYNKNIEDGIIDFAEKNEIDLLMVFPKHHGLAEKLTHHSHTRRMILRSSIPVMAMHS